MKIDQVMKLIDAGYSKNEIEALFVEDDDEKNKSMSEETEKKDAPHEQKNEPEKRDDLFSKMMDEFSKLKKTIQATNAANYDEKKIESRESIDEITKKIIGADAPKGDN